MSKQKWTKTLILIDDKYNSMAVSTDFFKARYGEGIWMILKGNGCFIKGQRQPSISHKTKTMVKPRLKSLFLILTILLSTERVLLVFLIVWGCRAPELSIRASVWGAGIEGPSHEDKREHTWLAVRVATVFLLPGLCTDRKGKVKNEAITAETNHMPLIMVIMVGVVTWIWRSKRHFMSKKPNKKHKGSHSLLSLFFFLHRDPCFHSPHSWQLTPLPRQVQSICVLPWLLNQRCPSK